MILAPVHDRIALCRQICASARSQHPEARIILERLR
jgi:hypothetical protein